MSFLSRCVGDAQVCGNLLLLERADREAQQIDISQLHCFLHIFWDYCNGRWWISLSFLLKGCRQKSSPFFRPTLKFVISGRYVGPKTATMWKISSFFGLLTTETGKLYRTEENGPRKSHYITRSFSKCFWVDLSFNCSYFLEAGPTLCFSPPVAPL